MIPLAQGGASRRNRTFVPERIPVPANPWRPASRGFTYIGILAFLAILSGGWALTVASLAMTQQREQETELLFVGHQFASAFRSYYSATPAGRPRYPSKLDDLLRDPRFAQPRRHLRRLYVDPTSGNTDWATVTAPGGGIMGVHSRSTRTPFRSVEQLPAWLEVTEATQLSDWVFAYAPHRQSTLPNRRSQQTEPDNPPIRTRWNQPGREQGFRW
jgi:type II secretory pathway pseudopilin PulG